jgi:ribosomal protein S18 acetylase RimI-like enzyme
MNETPIDFESEDCERLEAFLAERIYEFNSGATGHSDAKLLGAAIHNNKGEIVAGISGHTWAGSCRITQLWVHTAHRSRGLGRKLLRAAETEAKRRGCTNIIVDTHTFQAPGFYEHLGYEREGVVRNHPVGHSNIFYTKELPDHGA